MNNSLSMGAMASDAYLVGINSDARTEASLFRGGRQTHSEIKSLIKGVVERNFEDEVSLEDVARYLCVSNRTFNRRLKKCGIRFRDIVSESKCERAVGYLSGTEHSIEKIARILGYANSSNFVKAFKRWKGYTPSAYRKLLVEDANRLPNDPEAA